MPMEGRENGLGWVGAVQSRQYQAIADRDSLRSSPQVLALWRRAVRWNPVTGFFRAPIIRLQHFKQRRKVREL